VRGELLVAAGPSGAFFTRGDFFSLSTAIRSPRCECELKVKRAQFEEVVKKN